MRTFLANAETNLIIAQRAKLRDKFHQVCKRKDFFFFPINRAL